MNFEVKINGKSIGSLNRDEIERRASHWPAASVEVSEQGKQGFIPLTQFLARPNSVSPKSAGLLDQFDSLIPAGHYQIHVNGQSLGVFAAPDVIRRSKNWSNMNVEVSSPITGVLSLDAWLKRMATRFDALLWPRSADTGEYMLRTGGQIAVQNLSRAEIEWRAALGMIGPTSEVGTGSGPFVALNDFLVGALTPTPTQPHVGPSLQPAPNTQPAPPRATKTALQFGAGPYFVRVSGQMLGQLSRADIERRSQRWPSAATEVAENSTGPFVELAEFLRMPVPLLTPTPSLAPISQNFGPGPYYVRIGTAMLGPLQRDDIERRSRVWPVTAEVAEASAGPFVQLSQFLKMPSSGQAVTPVAIRPPTPLGISEHPATVVALTLITLNIYWLYWLSRTYKRIRQIDPLATKITPGRAWGFLFIPVFGAFWFIRIAFDLPRAILRVERNTTSKRRFACGTATIMCLLGSLCLWGIGLPVRARILWIIGCEALFLGFVAYCQAALNRASQTLAGAVPTRRSVEGLLLGAAGIGVACAALVLYFTLTPRPTPGPEPQMQRAQEALAAGDYAGAAMLLKKSDSAEAKFELACLYKNGLGVEQDPQMAVSLLEDSARAGLPLAETMLGLWYANGDGVEANSATAVDWYRKAASQGDSNAAELIGLAYAGGDGVVQDTGQAYMWFTVAAKRGNSDADSQKDMLSNLLTSTQKEQAESDAQAELAHESGGQQ